MENRIDRKSDENLYQPKIHSEKIRSLYRLKQETGKPMTVLLDQAIHDFAASYGTESPYSEQSFLRNADQETWEEICEYRKFLDELEVRRLSEELEKMKRNG